MAAPQQTQLRIDGLVAQACHLTVQDLSLLPRESVTEWIPDLKDGVTVQETWSGVRLSMVLRMAQPLPTARYVRIHAGHFVVPIALAEVDAAILVDSWNGQPLTVAYGAPWRLALVGGACFTRVKWIERLEVTAEPGENVGQALAQLRSQLQRSRAAAW
ncbi:MAG: molybdopterin-dependent oxidoreductase [Caldilineaceae bacterium]|nr:molybdopterin-dependent oxidoreductase [Caldilineaceae bacterium]